MPAPLLVVDAPFVLYRSYYALPESITGIDGHPVGGLLGATNVILRLIVERRPRATVICFGAEAATYRTALYPGYHAARPPVPEPLAWQFERAPALWQAFGWTCVDSDEVEADDFLGSFATAEAAAGGSTLILTGDRDMYQCADARTKILYLKGPGVDEVDHDEVVARYGIEPAQVPDFIALRGDPSDGLPGAPGIGAKTAAELLVRHGSLEGVLAGAAGEKPRIAASLSDNAEMLRAYREIALLRSFEVELPADAEVDLAGGSAAAAALGIGALSRRLAKAQSLDDL
jgi:5'-3' exonuclease